MTKCVYICSAGHSGSTLLDLLLGTHTKVASLGEISHLPKNISLNTICTCGEPVQSCQLWKEVLNRISYSIGVDIRINPYAFNLGAYRAKVVVDKSHQTPGVRYQKKVACGAALPEVEVWVADVAICGTDH